MTRRAVFHDAGSFDDGAGAISSFPSSGAVSSVFGRTGAVLAVSGDYAGVVAAFLSGATAASRYAGATASGAPASGSFLKGDFVIDQTGKVWVCTAAGSPGTWADVASGASVGYATPAIVLGSAAAAGSASTVIRSDSTIAAFDATNPTTQAFGDAAAVGTAAFAARRDHKHAMPSVPIGSSALVYRYTVTGSDKSSIDTGVDTADAGSNDWTNGDVLEVFIYARTDEVVVASAIQITVNDDTSSIYDRMTHTANNTTPSAAPSLAQANWARGVAGASCASGVFGMLRITLPNYRGTVGNKFGEMTGGIVDTTAANDTVLNLALGYRSTTAISRLKILPATGGAKLKVGTQLLIYKRLAA